MKDPLNSKGVMKALALPAPEVDITKTSIWRKCAPGTLGPSHDILAANQEVLALQNQEIRGMLANLLSTKSAAKVHARQQEASMWADEAVRERIIGLSRNYHGKMVRTASKHSGGYARLWRGFCLKELQDGEIDRGVRQSLEHLGEGPLLVMYLRCSKLVQATGPKVKKSAEEGKQAKKTLGKRKRAEAEDEESDGEEDDRGEEESEEEDKEDEDDEEGGEER